MSFINKYQTLSAYTSDAEKEYPNVSLVVNENRLIWSPSEPEIDYSHDYLTIEALEYTEVGWHPATNAQIQYSTNNGQSWLTMDNYTVVPLNAGEKVIFRDEEPTIYATDGIGTFTSTGRIKAYGNILSMYYFSNFDGADLLGTENYVFARLFKNCTGLTDASGIVMPHTLANFCFFEMFAGCSNLVKAPKLKTTTLKESCYAAMFQNCSSLTTAPALPATTLADSCYKSMFAYCTSLTTAPELPATVVTFAGYDNMFAGCSNLNYVKCLATDISAYHSTNNWLYGVALSGTFVRTYISYAQWTEGASGIPQGWSVVSV